LRKLRIEPISSFVCLIVGALLCYAAMSLSSQGGDGDGYTVEQRKAKDVAIEEAQRRHWDLENDDISVSPRNNDGTYLVDFGARMPGGSSATLTVKEGSVVSVYIEENSM
jgi:hypothetical protein